jgi:hypothetical protein
MSVLRATREHFRERAVVADIELVCQVCGAIEGIGQGIGPVIVVVGGVSKTLQLCCACASRHGVDEHTQDLAERVGQLFPPGRPEPSRRPPRE